MNGFSFGDKKKITKIAITGGPCDGKTSVLEAIRQALEPYGYYTVTIPETATELISGGISPTSLDSKYNYQLYQMQLQLAKESIYTKAALHLGCDKKILVVCDRGVMDSKAYMTDREFQKAAKELGLDEIQLRDSYDGVFHLMTTAKGDVKNYTTSNNRARTENPQQASLLDDGVIRAWLGHPRFKVIDNTGGFENKTRRLIDEIFFLLGEKQAVEIERKFLIEYPDISFLQSNPFCKAVEIEQIYLDTDEKSELRIRKRGHGNSFVYFMTEKRDIDGLTRTETEVQISEEKYNELANEKAFKKSKLTKTRYCLLHNGKCLEIDIYPFWKDKAIMEAELEDADEKVEFPKEIKVIKEVTRLKEYKNRQLAQKYF